MYYLPFMKTTAKFIALIATGLLAGCFFYGSLNLVPTFYEVPVNIHLLFRTQLMNHNGITVQTLMGLSIIVPLLYAWLNRRTPVARNFAILAACLALTALLVTRFGNVPINQMMRTWEPSAPPENWRAILSRWDVFNLIRTAAGVGCFLSMITAGHIPCRK
jgi:uncharacterized membrane protein